MKSTTLSFQSDIIAHASENIGRKALVSDDIESAKLGFDREKFAADVELREAELDQGSIDVYGHLFPTLEDDHAKIAAGELRRRDAGGAI
jgi:hypothetical protein